MIIGRIEEINKLKNLHSSNKAEFIAVYGRRRVGKTFLIREAFGYRFTFQHAGLSEGGMKEQIYAFSSSLKDAGYEVRWTISQRLVQPIICFMRKSRRMREAGMM